MSSTNTAKNRITKKTISLFTLILFSLIILTLNVQAKEFVIQNESVATTSPNLK